MRVEFVIYPQSPSVLYATESLSAPIDWKPIMRVEATDRKLVVSVEIGDKPQEFFKVELDGEVIK